MKAIDEFKTDDCTSPSMNATGYIASFQLGGKN